jgi:hypothetical protein
MKEVFFISERSLKLSINNLKHFIESYKELICTEELESAYTVLRECAKDGKYLVDKE